MIASALPSLSVTPVASAGSGPSTGAAAGSAEPAAEGFARWLDQATHTEDAGPGASASPIAAPGNDKAPLDDDRGAPDAHSAAPQPSPPATPAHAAKLGGRSGSLPVQRPPARPGPGVEAGQPDGLRLAGVSAAVDTGSATGTDRPAQTDSADPMPTATATLPVVPTVDVSALLAAWNGGAVPVDAALAQALAAGNGNTADAADLAPGGAPPAASAAARAGVASRLGGSPRASDPIGGTPVARRGRAAADEPTASAAGQPSRPATAEAQLAAGDASTAEAAAKAAQAATAAAVALASPAARSATAAGAPAASTAAAAGAADRRATPDLALAAVGPRAPANLPAAAQGPTAAPDTAAGPTAQSAAAGLSTTPTGASSANPAVGAIWGPLPTEPASVTPPTASATPLSSAAVAGAVDATGTDAAGQPAAIRVAAAPGSPAPATEPADALQGRLAKAPATASSVIDAAARASDRPTGDAPWAAEAAPSTRRTGSDVDGPTPTPTEAARTAAHAVALGGAGGPVATGDDGPPSRADGTPALQTEARTGALTRSTGDRRAAVAEPVGPASVTTAAAAAAAALSPRDTGSIRQRDSGSENSGSAANIGASSGAPWNGALAWFSGATAGMTAATERASDGRIMDSPGSTGFAPQLAAHITTWVRDGVQEARLELNPAEMGPLTVQIQLDGHAARVHLAAEHAQTRAALEQAMPQLAGSLRENGLTLSGGGVFEQPRQSQPSQTDTGSGDGGSQANGDGQNGRGTHAGRDSANPQPSGTNGANAITGRRRSGVVDLVA